MPQGRAPVLLQSANLLYPPVLGVYPYRNVTTLLASFAIGLAQYRFASWNCCNSTDGRTDSTCNLTPQVIDARGPLEAGLFVD
jgi:hypothetical protein